MKIVSAKSAFPKDYYKQEELFEALVDYWGNQLEKPEVLRRLYNNVGVDGRYLSIPIDDYRKLKGWGEANDHWIRTAMDLGEQAIRGAASAVGLDVREIGAIFFTSVTGISAPSVDALLVNKMGLSPNIKRTPIFGLGCVAGAAGIAKASDYVRAYPDQVAVTLAVELCSLTIQRQDLSMANLIASGLFGDGAAAAIVAGDNHKLNGPSDGPKILGTKSVFYPATEEMMGWKISERGFAIILSPEVPNLIQGNLGADVQKFFAGLGRDVQDVKSWVLHTGGPKVLQATASALGLQNGELAASWECLRRTGNLSSASVLCVLEEVMQNRRPAPGTLGLLAAMGPGFCSELVALEW